MITKEELIKACDLYFSGKEINFLPEMRYEDIDIRFPKNPYIFSSSIQLNFECKDEFYFIDISYSSSNDDLSTRGWYRDYDAYKTVFGLGPAIGLSVLGHFSGYDDNGGYIMQPSVGKKLLSGDNKMAKILDAIEELIEELEKKFNK